MEEEKRVDISETVQASEGFKIERDTAVFRTGNFEPDIWTKVLRCIKKNFVDLLRSAAHVSESSNPCVEREAVSQLVYFKISNLN